MGCFFKLNGGDSDDCGDSDDGGDNDDSGDSDNGGDNDDCGVTEVRQHISGYVERDVERQVPRIFVFSSHD